MKREQYSQKNNVELSGRRNSMPDEAVENTVIKISKESGIYVKVRDIGGCPQVLLSRNSRGHDKRAIVKFFSRKYTELLLKDKKNKLVVKISGIYMSLTTFLYLPIFSDAADICGVNVIICKGKENWTMLFV